MKKILFCAVSVAMMLASCNEGPSPELVAAQRSNDSLQAIVDAKSNEINTLFETLNQIEDNLALVASKYSTVQELRRKNPEGNSGTMSEIAAQIDHLDKMLADNKKKISYLNEKLQAFGQEKGSLQEFVSKLENRIADQEQMIASLNAEIEDHKATINTLNQNVSFLTAQNEEQTRTIERQTAEANRAYFIVGQFDHLRELGVVSKTGGFIGIGRRQTLETNLPTQEFTEIDRSTTDAIPVELPNAIILSSHPAGSYELVHPENNAKYTIELRILDSRLFWQNTSYLVISTK